MLKRLTTTTLFHKIMDGDYREYSYPNVVYTTSGTFNKKEDSNMGNVENTLQERGNRYGEFADHAKITQALKSTANDFLLNQYKVLSPAHQEALDMIFHKIGRILNGDPNYKDSWHDIAGYATLAENECVEEPTFEQV